MFIKLFKFIVIIVLAYTVGRLVVLYKDSRLDGYRAPYIQMLSADGVVIRWMTEDNQLGVLHYGEDMTHMSSLGLESAKTKNHRMKLGNLKPATRYYYQTGDIGRSHFFDPGKHWFYTHTEEVAATRIWVMGNSGEAGETLDRVRDSAYGWMNANPLDSVKHRSGDTPLIDVWLALGNLAYRSGTNAQFQSAVFDTFGDLTSNTALWPVYGPRDARRWTYFRIFDLPKNAEAGGVASNTEHYYSMDYANAHFIMLDSQDSDRSITGDMANWLKEDLANNTLPWVIVAFHHPPYTRGNHDSDDGSDSKGRMQEMRENILPILEKAGVDLVLSSHSQVYERSYLLDCAYQNSAAFSEQNKVSAGVNGEHKDYLKPLNIQGNQGTVYVVAGSSSNVDTGPLDHPAHHVALQEAGSVVVDIDGNKLTARFINAEGQVRDEFSISKEADYHSAYAGCEP